jgi:signal transduction histidine kinase
MRITVLFVTRSRVAQVTFRRIRDMTAEASPVVVCLDRAGFGTTIASFAAMIGFGIGVGRLTRDAPPLPVVVVAGVVATGMAVLLLRRWRPLLLYAVVAGAGIAVIASNRSANFVWLALLAITGWCTLAGGRRLGLAYWLPSMVLFTVEWTAIKPDPGWGAWLAGNTFMVLAGELVRYQLGLVAQLRAAQADLAAKARAEERNRISRDLHDVIAHTLTVSLLHVMSARLAVEHDPADAARALAEAERLGRESLAEVRQVVGFLRDDPRGSRGMAPPGEETSTPATTDSDGGPMGARAEANGSAAPLHAPLPSAADLPTLVERFQSAGVDVTLTVYGDTGRLPGTVGLAVYRILQEALTNVIKHAPAALTTAVLTVSAREATLTVDNLSPPRDGTGHNEPTDSAAPDSTPSDSAASDSAASDSAASDSAVSDSAVSDSAVSDSAVSDSAVSGQCPASGHGVASMRERAESLGGTCQAGPSGGGWQVLARFPLAAPEVTR